MMAGLCCGVHKALSEKVLPWVTFLRTTGFIFFFSLFPGQQEHF